MVMRSLDLPPVNMASKKHADAAKQPNKKGG
jgi:hypothetical protein